MGARGEREIVLPDGDEVEILFTNQSLAEAEQRLGKSSLAVMQGMLNGQSGVNDVANLLRAGANAANRANGKSHTISLKQAYDIMDKAGFQKCMVAVMEAVSEVLTYDGEESEDSDPN